MTRDHENTISTRPGTWLAVLLVAALHASPALAAGPGGGDPCQQASPSLDADQDGYTDAEECLGLDAGAAFAYPSCRDAAAIPPDCLDPLRADVFVALVPCDHPTQGAGCGTAGSSAYTDYGISPEEAFAFANEPTSSGGLGPAFHVVDVASLGLTGCSRCVTPRQSGLVIREDRTSDFGTCTAPRSYGEAVVDNANEIGEATVYTLRIAGHMNACIYDVAEAQPGATPGINDRAAGIRTEIRKVTVHEMDHAQRLAPDDVTRYYGSHYVSGSGCLMDAGSTYSEPDADGSVVLNIPTDHCRKTRSVAASGATSDGPIHCGDTFPVLLDGDGFQSCLPSN